MKEYLVIGLGYFGQSIVRSLMVEGNEVLAIDTNKDRVNSIKDEVTHAVQADATSRNALESLDAGNFDVGIITIKDNTLASILSTVLLNKMGVDEVIVRAGTDLHGDILKEVGADMVVFPEREMGEKITKNLIAADMDVMDFIHFEADYSIIELSVPEYLAGKKIKECDLFSVHNLDVIVVTRGKQINIKPEKSYELKEGDVAAIVGEDENLEKMMIDLRNRSMFGV